MIGIFSKAIRKKGYILTLDVTIGLIILLSVLTLSAVIINNAQSGTFLELQQTRIANDIITVLDEQGILQTYNATLINNTMRQILPPNFEMYLAIRRYEYDAVIPNFIFRNLTTVGSVVNTTDRFIGQGKRTFVRMTDASITNYSTVEYNIWVK